MFEQPQVISALITGVCGIIAVVIASITGHLIGKKFLNQKKLQADLDQAIGDIHFLLEVERRHCEIHKKMGEPSQLRTVRKQVKNETGEAWSRRFTPGRVSRKTQT